ncbi:MAG: DNA translocase FtsK 4TM domain-containing protein [Anaerolineae bacterium]
MAKKTTRGKGTKKPDPAAGSGFQFEMGIGIVLFALAVGTFLSMVFPRGEITDWWLQFLRRLFGWAFVISPLLIGGGGVLLIMDSLDKQLNVRLRHIIGIALLLLGALGLWHMTESAVTHVPPDALADMGRGGGYVGEVIETVLRSTLGAFGAALVLVLVILAGVILTLPGPAKSAMQWLSATVQDLTDWLRRRRMPINRPASVAPRPIPMGPEDDLTIRAGGRVQPSNGGLATPPANPQPAPANPSPRPPKVYGSDPLAPAATQPAAPPQNTPAAPAPPPPAASPSGVVVARTVGANRDFQLPTLSDILEQNIEQEVSRDEIRQNARIIEDTLSAFGVPARVVEVNQGPAITQFGVEPGFVEKKDAKGQVTRSKVKVNKISALANDLALALAAPTIRIEAPVPGRPVVGIEVPNTKAHVVALRGVVESESFQDVDGPGHLAIALGQDVAGQPVAVDLTKMPHLLIAGATGSGKSVCINAIVASLTLTHTPQTLRFLMVDPKRVELVQYNGIPHLLADVVVDIEAVVPLLNLAVKEMDTRYRLFAKVGARNIEGYNAIAESKGEKKLPFIVLIIDELADLMMVAPEDVERLVCRLAQMARATGIHLILATQRPSVDVVTGLIKANFPARIAFAVTSLVDSRVILDGSGAEKLLGRGDMLYMAPDASKLQRLQGCYVSDVELDRLVRYWKGMGPPLGSGPGLPTSLSDDDQSSIPGATAWPPPDTPAAQAQTWSRSTTPARPAAPPPSPFGGYETDDEDDAPRDELWDQAIEVVRDAKTASASLLQRKLRIGYQRATRLIEEMEREGILSPPEGPMKARRVLLQDDPDDEDDDSW